MIPIMHDMLAAPPLMRRTIINDESTISSNLTMDTRMDAVENNMLITNTNIGNLDNSVNFMNHMLKNSWKNLSMMRVHNQVQIRMRWMRKRSHQIQVLRSSRLHTSATRWNESVYPGWIKWCTAHSPWRDSTTWCGSRDSRSLGGRCY